MKIKEFQQLMRQLYFKNDYERGVLKTTLWLFEEIGELARAILKDRSYEELEEELADIVAWTASLANILNVDLVTAINKKYNYCLNLLTNFDLSESWSV
jgi:NTP pyrophosphatase (non-canonical NTP hydrolase)